MLTRTEKVKQVLSSVKSYASGKIMSVWKISEEEKEMGAVMNKRLLVN